LRGKALTVYGDGSQTRSFCYIDDLIDGIYELMLSEINEPINIGSQDEITILELVNKIVQLAGSKSKIAFKLLPADDPKVRRPDISKAKKELRWQPKVGLEEGLKKTISWFQQK